jgi:hypothetical protein
MFGGQHQNHGDGAERVGVCLTAKKKRCEEAKKMKKPLETSRPC